MAINFQIRHTINEALYPTMIGSRSISNSRRGAQPERILKLNNPTELMEVQNNLHNLVTKLLTRNRVRKDREFFNTDKSWGNFTAEKSWGNLPEPQYQLRLTVSTEGLILIRET